jgi:F-type H+-transporting ATPase subunit delta
MASDAAAKRYADALFEIGVEHDKLDALHDQLEGVLGAFRQSKDFRNLLLHPSIDVDVRRNALREVADSWGLDQLVVNFLFILLDNERVRALQSILEAYREQLDKREGNLRATVTTAVELDDEQSEAIQEVLSEKFGKDIILTTETDEELIGGAVARVGGRVYDGSVSNQLDQLKDNILEEV